MKLLRHLAGYLPVNLAAGISAFGGVYVFTRLLDADEYGRYALMVSVMALVHTLSLTPAEAAAYRFAGQAVARDRLADHFRTALSLTLRSLILAGALIAVLAVTLGKLPEYARLLPWIAVLIPLNTLIQMALEAHRAAQHVHRYAVIETARLLVGFALGALIAWKTGFGAASPFIGMIVVAVILVVPEAVWLARQAVGGTTSPGHRRQYLTYGVPVAAALVLDLILSASDRFLLAWFIDEAAVGQYAAGYGVADKTVLLLCAWAAMAASPLIMAAYERSGPDGARQEARGLINTLLLIGVPAATGLALVARPLAEALIGADVRTGAMQIIPWIAVAGLLNGLLIHYISEAFQLTHRTGLRALLMLVPAGANIALNLILIPLHGIMGAVIATVASYAIGLLTLGFAGRRLIALPVPLGDFARILACALLMAPAVSIIPAWGSWPELLAKTAIGGLTYVGAAVALDAGGARRFLRQGRSATKGAQRAAKP